MKYLKTYEKYNDKLIKRLGEPPFEIGDYVYCLESSTGSNLNIIKGEIYQIDKILPGEYEYMCSLNGDKYGFYCEKFRKLSKKELKNLKIKLDIDKYNL